MQKSSSKRPWNGKAVCYLHVCASVCLPYVCPHASEQNHVRPHTFSAFLCRTCALKCADWKKRKTKFGIWLKQSIWISHFKHFRLTKQLWVTVYSNCSTHCLHHQKIEHIHSFVEGRSGVSKEAEVFSLVGKCQSFIRGWLIHVVFKMQRKEKRVFFPSVKMSALTSNSSIKEMTFQIQSVFYSALSPVLAKGYCKWKNL